MDKCIFCGSKVEVEQTQVDIPNNLQPVCIACRENWQDACREAMVEEKDETRR